MKEIKVAKHIAILSEAKDGWQKELNIASIDGESYGYDVREWSLDHSKNKDGISLSNDEATALVAVLQECLKDGNDPINLKNYPGIYKQGADGQLTMFVEKDKMFYQLDTAVTEFLDANNIRYIDKREKGGALWIVGGHEIDEIMKKAAENGFKFTFSEKGGKATKGQPGWFFR